MIYFSCDSCLMFYFKRKSTLHLRTRIRKSFRPHVEKYLVSTPISMYLDNAPCPLVCVSVVCVLSTCLNSPLVQLQITAEDCCRTAAYFPSLRPTLVRLGRPGANWDSLSHEPPYHYGYMDRHVMEKLVMLRWRSGNTSTDESVAIDHSKNIDSLCFC